MSYLLRVYTGNMLVEHELELNRSYHAGGSSDEGLILPGIGMSFTIETDGKSWRGNSRDKRYRSAFGGGVDQALQTIVVLDAEKKIAVTVYQSGPANSHSIDISNEDSISIGRSSSCDIVLKDHQVSGQHLKLFRKGDKWAFEDNGSSNGTYLNKTKAREGLLDTGDVLTIGFCRLIIANSTLTIVAPCSIFSNLIHSRRLQGVTSPEAPYPYLFKRSPRLREKIPNDTFDLQAPPSIGGKPTISWLNVLLPPILTVGVMLTICFFVTNTMTMLYFSAPMTIIGVLMSVIRYRGEKKMYLATQQLRLEKYDAYLDEQTAKIERCIQEQRRVLTEDAPSVQQCVHLAEGPDRKLWDRRVKDADFLSLRLGTGAVPAAITIKCARKVLSLEEDALADRPAQITDKYSQVPDCPINIDFGKYPTCGIIGERQACITLGKNLIIQATAHHSYDDLRIVVLCDKGETDEWSFCRWLPHLFDDTRSQRFVANSQAQQKKLLDSLEEILSQRWTEISEEQGEVHASATRPFYLFICASLMVSSHRAMRYLTANDPRLGVGAIFLFDRIEDLPKESFYIVDLSAKPYQVYEREFASHKQSFSLDYLVPDQYEMYARLMAPLRIDDGGGKAVLPTSISFLQGYHAQRPQMLGLEKYWQNAMPEQGMAVPIGVRETGEPFLFDIHEKHYGPHGLVAGMTGSGKSEMVQSWILSMAVHFPPEAVSFVLIDFKGTGLLLPLKNLPHLAGCISDLDTSIGRNLIALENELTRRKALLDQHQVSNISAYLKLLRRGQATEPLPYLFLVIDEFAEFKLRFPDFMEVVNRIFAIGRTLGVHIILLTQKPASVVDDKMMANTRFRWCLKVASSADSRDMLHHPDAAKITNPGRAFVQVGEDEVYEEIQSFWSGAPYNPYRDLSLRRETRVSIVDLQGNRQCYEPEKTTGYRSEKNEIDAVVEYIDDYCRKNQIPRARAIWTSKLPEQLQLRDLLQIAFDGEKWSKTEQGLRVTVGLLDDPRSQSQYPFYFNLSEEGHTAIYGAPGAGKTTLLHTVAMSIALTYPPDAIHIYMMDFGGGSLNLFQAIPHVGGIAVAGDDERMLKLADMLSSELKSRKKEIASLGLVSAASYREATGKEMPYIVLLLDNFVPVLEMYPGLEGVLQSIVREGASCDIYIVMTTGGPNTIPYRISQNIKASVALHMADSMDYAGIVGKTNGLAPENHPGRGLARGNPPLEFQVALPAVGRSETERTASIRAMARLMTEKWNGDRAGAIPVMPEQVRASDYPCNEMFLGLTCQDIRPATVDMRTHPFLLISQGGADNHVMALIIRQVLEKLEPKTIVLSGSIPGLEIPVTQEMDIALKELMPELQRRKDALTESGLEAEKYPYIAVLIPDLKATFEKVTNESMKRLNSIVVLGERLNVVLVVQGQAEDINRFYNAGETFTNSFVRQAVSLLMGGKSSVHSVLPVNLPLSEQNVLLNEGQGYLIRDKETLKIKVLQ